MGCNVEFKLQILQRNVGLKYIDLEQMHGKKKMIISK
jgi:hypothetical protein